MSTNKPSALGRPRLMKVPELAKRWQLSERHVQRLIARGSIPIVRLPGCKAVRIRVEDVHAAEIPGAPHDVGTIVYTQSPRSNSQPSARSHDPIKVLGIGAAGEGSPSPTA